ncbi:response regulator transcription factor [Burkholderia gladioli]|uniref:response regulator transcription factor n=1 Tax=Burkholderia gladioli TaxID=28095 RepID=UPI0006273DF4|nr:response regulator [Burkholderia gladioli]KAF1064977.1 Response regulator protein TmoT [Burkholderia gladioli]KKJ05618.1 chemotaxis protein CheY [Burkholderia gladioli]MDN7501026.1 response regulator [Burkholderia gladioli]MDN7605029.1 response regulator [Burkholderia gladioli]WAG21090.1 DNA-binding response regulator [Burkholderia gladioli]
MNDTQDLSASELICIVDDDADVRESLDTLLRSHGHRVRAFDGPEAFLACDDIDAAACLILDVRLRGVDGLDFQQELAESDTSLPVILMSGYGDIPMTVRGMRAGAITFLSKPFDESAMLAAIDEALARGREQRTVSREKALLRARFEALTPRERDVLGLVSAGLMNKQIAGRLELSEITVKIHRGNLMRKMEADSLADLVLMAQALGVREPVSRYQK